MDLSWQNQTKNITRNVDGTNNAMKASYSNIQFVRIIILIIIIMIMMMIIMIIIMIIIIIIIVIIIMIIIIISQLPMCGIANQDIPSSITGKST